MIIERTLPLKSERHDDLSAADVLRKTEEALNDPTVTRIEVTPRWERRKDAREAAKKRGKRRTYR